MIAADVTERALAEMHDAGVRGVRFNFVKRLGGGKPLGVYRVILDAIEPLGWHVVVYFDAEDLESWRRSCAASGSRWSSTTWAGCRWSKASRRSPFDCCASCWPATTSSG